MIVSGSDDKTIKLWDVKTSKEIRTFENEYSVMSVNFILDGTVITSVSRCGIIKLWNVKTGELIKTFNAQYKIISVAFSPEGAMMVSVHENDQMYSTIKLWKLYNEKEIEELKNNTSTVCLLLLQTILHAYKNEGNIINLSDFWYDFPELQKVFQSLQPNEKELVEYLISDIAKSKENNVLESIYSIFKNFKKRLNYFNTMRVS